MIVLAAPVSTSTLESSTDKQPYVRVAVTNARSCRSVSRTKPPNPQPQALLECELGLARVHEAKLPARMFTTKLAVPLHRSSTIQTHLGNLHAIEDALVVDAMRFERLDHEPLVKMRRADLVPPHASGYPPVPGAASARRSNRSPERRRGTNDSERFAYPTTDFVRPVTAGAGVPQNAAANCLHVATRSCVIEWVNIPRDNTRCSTGCRVIGLSGGRLLLFAVFASLVGVRNAHAGTTWDCKSTNGQAEPDANVICIDASNTSRQPSIDGTAAPEGVYLVSPAIGRIRPNHPTVVNVTTRPTERATVALGGLAGPTSPLLVGSLGDDGGQNSGTSVVFAPRKPGGITLTVNIFTATDDSDAKPKRSFTYELFVPQPYFGALRVGLSGVFGYADHSYTARMDPGSQVSRVIENPYRPFTNELVVGYSQFFQGFTSERGRMPSNCHGLIAKGGIYFGLGVASASPTITGGTKTDWLRSFYVGYEYELTDGFSVALTLVVRRTDEPAEGVNPGAPIGSMATLTESDWRPGFGVVLSFSPDLFKFASSVGGK